jgi:molecular chaperone DnaJ
LDIACDLPVSFVTATLGGKIEVPTLKGKTIMKIHAGTQPDKILRLKGLGFPSLKGNQTGDQIFNVKIEIPTKLSARQKELLQDYAKESGMTAEADGDGFFDKMKTFFE